MRRYDEKIINTLLDSFERSKLASGTNQRDISVAYRVSRKNLPEYFDEASVQYETVHEQMEALETAGLVKLFWRGGRRGHILEKCVLRTDQDALASAYTFVGRKPQKAKEEVLLQICEEWLEKLPKAGASAVTELSSAASGPESANTPLVCFLEELQRCLQTNRSVRAWVDPDHPEEFRRLCRLMNAILSNTGEYYLRQFSISVFHDSKLAEKEISHACRIIREFHPDPAFREMDWEDILAEYNIYRNPAWVYVKGKGTFSLMEADAGPGVHLPADCASSESSSPSESSSCAEADLPSEIRPLPESGLSSRDCGKDGNDDGGALWVSLAGFRGGLGLSNGDLERLRWRIEDRPAYILTIENLTSFHQWTDARGLCLYLGGFANAARREFLKSLHAGWPDVPMLHFGDIDCGGFRIWKNLVQSAGLPVRPYKMDLETYQKYKSFGRQLTENDRKTLGEMLTDPFFAGSQKELFGEMLKDGLKLEQECIYDN